MKLELNDVAVCMLDDEVPDLAGMLARRGEGLGLGKQKSGD